MQSLTNLVQSSLHSLSRIKCSNIDTEVRDPVVVITRIALGYLLGKKTRFHFTEDDIEIQEYSSTLTWDRSWRGDNIFPDSARFCRSVHTFIAWYIDGNSETKESAEIIANYAAKMFSSMRKIIYADLPPIPIVLKTYIDALQQGSFDTTYVSPHTDLKKWTKGDFETLVGYFEQLNKEPELEDKRRIIKKIDDEVFLEKVRNVYNFKHQQPVTETDNKKEEKI